MRVLLGTNVKDEPNMEEWMEYHLKMGVDEIWIWDDESEIPVKSEDSRVHIERTSGNKSVFMKQFWERAKKRTDVDWAVYLDGDEYLYLGGKNVPEYFQTIQEDIDGILIPWLLFGSNYKNKETNTGKVVSEYTKCHYKTNLYIKTIARPGSVAGVENAHTLVFNKKKPKLVYAQDGSMMDQNRCMIPERMTIPTKETVCIAHYATQSWDRFCFRRSRHRDDTSTLRHLPYHLKSDGSPPECFHKYNNSCEFPYVWEFYKKQLFF